MYGLINDAIKQMVIETFDQEKWVEISREAEIKETSFRPFEQYDDEITEKLVSVISEKISMEAPLLLEKFGEYWVNYAKDSEYSSILNAFATSPVELIKSLDSLHTRLEITFEQLKAPSFYVTTVSDKEILVHYSTERELPLKYFVVGLIKGIFNMFDQTCQVDIIEPKNNETAVFKVVF